MGHADSFGRHIPGRRFPPYNVTGLNKSRGGISVGVFLRASALRNAICQNSSSGSTVNKLSIIITVGRESHLQMEHHLPK